ncbi:MAG: type III pantothenate kinase [Flavobacteriales bacterium]
MPAVERDLVLDVGNSRTKLGLFEHGRLVAQAVVPLGDLHAVKAFIGERPLLGIALGSTAAADDGFVRALGDLAPVLVVTGTTPAPIHSAYASPLSLGADRLANAVAAVQRFPGRPVLVFDLGTCITYDLCLADGSYVGGGISPGLRMRARAMNAYSARLPLVDPADAPVLLGADTGSSLAAGIHFGILGELEGLIRRVGQQVADLGVVLTGGDALRFVRGLESGIFALPHLTLEGYHALLAHHRTPGGRSGPDASGGRHGPGAAG